MWMKLIELPHLALGAPEQVAVPGLPQVEMRDVLEAARCIETRGKLARECLVVDEAVRSCRSDRPFVEPHRLGIPALDARDLGSDQRGAVLEVRRAVLGPFLQLAMVSCQSVLVVSTIRGGCRSSQGDPGKRGGR